MTKRQKLMLIVINEKRKFIIENWDKVDSIRMEKEETEISKLLLKLPVGCKEKFKSPYAE